MSASANSNRAVLLCRRKLDALYPKGVIVGIDRQGDLYRRLELLTAALGSDSVDALLSTWGYRVEGNSPETVSPIPSLGKLARSLEGEGCVDRRLVAGRDIGVVRPLDGAQGDDSVESSGSENGASSEFTADEGGVGSSGERCASVLEVGAVPEEDLVLSKDANSPFYEYPLESSERSHGAELREGKDTTVEASPIKIKVLAIDDGEVSILNLNAIEARSGPSKPAPSQSTGGGPKASRVDDEVLSSVFLEQGQLEPWEKPLPPSTPVPEPESPAVVEIYPEPEPSTNSDGEAESCQPQFDVTVDELDDWLLNAEPSIMIDDPSILDMLGPGVLVDLRVSGDDAVEAWLGDVRLGYVDRGIVSIYEDVDDDHWSRCLEEAAWSGATATVCEYVSNNERPFVSLSMNASEVGKSDPTSVPEQHEEVGGIVMDGPICESPLPAEFHAAEDNSSAAENLHVDSAGQPEAVNYVPDYGKRGGFRLRDMPVEVLELQSENGV